MDEACAKSNITEMLGRMEAAGSRVVCEPDLETKGSDGLNLHLGANVVFSFVPLDGGMTVSLIVIGIVGQAVWCKLLSEC